MLNWIDEKLEFFGHAYSGMNIILAGDFNSLNGTTISSRTGLQPLVRMPTRGSNTLDQIFVGNVCSYKIKTVKSIVKSDHLAIIAHTDQMLNLNKMNKSVIFRKKSPAQNFAFLNEINTTSDFDDILKIDDVQDACNLLYVKLNHYTWINIIQRELSL